MHPLGLLAALRRTSCHSAVVDVQLGGRLPDTPLLSVAALQRRSKIQTAPEREQEGQIQFGYRQPYPTLRESRPRLLTSDHPTGHATLGH